MQIYRKDDDDCAAPVVRTLDEYLALAIPAPPEPPPGIALEYPGEGPEGAPFRGEDREHFIRQTAAYALEVGLSEYETRERLLVFSEDFCSPPLPDPEVLALMAEEWES